jgi:hypothetical protein
MSLTTLLIFIFSALSFYGVLVKDPPNKDVDVSLEQLLPIVDETGKIHLNIPTLLVSEFSLPDEVHTQIRIVSTAVYFHYWLRLISRDDMLERLCKLYVKFPLYCSEVGYRQYNYTHCLDNSETGEKFYARRQDGYCPKNQFDRIFGADILYDVFLEANVHVEFIPEF